MIIFESCVSDCGRLYDYFIRHYSSQAIKLDSENLCTSDLTSSPMLKTYTSCWGSISSNISENIRSHTEMKSRINKQFHSITRNGPQRPNGTA